MALASEEGQRRCPISCVRNCAGVMPALEVSNDVSPRLQRTHDGSLGRLPRRKECPEGGPLSTATVRSIATSRPTSVALENACLCARIAAENKARDILVLDMREQSPLFDYFVLATGASR